MNTEQVNKMLVSHGALTSLILTVSNGLSTLIGWFNSVDVRGWWPISLSLQIAIGFVYAALFAAIVKRTHILSFKFNAIYNSILGLILVLHSYLFYAIKIDWSEVGPGGTKQLVLMQKIIYSDLTPWAIYVFFLFVTLVVCLAKSNQDRDRIEI